MPRPTIQPQYHQHQHQHSSYKWSWWLPASPLFRGIVIGFAMGLVTGQVSLVSKQLPATKCQCNCGDTTTTTSTTTSTSTATTGGSLMPFERTPIRDYLPGKHTDAYTYFHDYIRNLGQISPESPKDFPTLPLLHIWPNFFEAYHNHWNRYRGKDKVVFMEIGVQSGGKIPMLRDYFGPGFVYIGIDINPSCKMFESEEWVHIEIGDSGNREFLESIMLKYMEIDIFLDDGGHTMQQQRLAMELLLPHIKPDGVYMCEDLSTSWVSQFGGIPWGDSTLSSFGDTTMGLIHKSLDWLNSGWMSGKVMNYEQNHPRLDSFWQDTPYWRQFVQTVKSIHCYNQLVVYEKGLVETPFHTMTVGQFIPYQYSGDHQKVQWGPILARIQSLTKSPW